MPPADAVPGASLSFTAERLLGDLERQLLGDAAPVDWLQALIDRDRALATVAALETGVLAGAEIDLDSLATHARGAPTTGPTLTATTLANAAARRADDDGRAVASVADVAAAVCAAVLVAPPVVPPREALTEVEELPETQPEGLLVGQSAQAPVTVVGGRPRTFRLFVSSPFKDLEAERNILHERVYPAVARYCRERGARFQPIDLRWGVSEEASLDQQAMRICLGEIERCRAVTPRPNFLVLLGNRYGWLALPEQIPAAEWDQIVGRVGSEAERRFLDRWYLLDENAVPDPDHPGARRLRPRTGPWAPPAHEPTEPVGAAAARKDEELRRWEEAETQLRQILTGAVRDLELGEDRRRVYETSATEQEIRAGALRDGAGGASYGFIREIALTDDDEDGAIAEAADPLLSVFVDADEMPRDNRHGPLANLKRELGPRIVERYEARWRRSAPTDDEASQPIAVLELDARALEAFQRAGIHTIADLTGVSAPELAQLVGHPEREPSLVDGARAALDRMGLALRDEGSRPTTAHLGQLAERVLDTLRSAIDEELARPVAPAASRPVQIAPHAHLDVEGEAHRDFAEQRIQHFVGRTGPLRTIEAYLGAGDPVALVVHGDGGSGKSALLSEVVHRAQRQIAPVLVYRFIGATPESIDGRSLLASICRELARCYGADPATVPGDFQELIVDLGRRLRSATADRPIIVLIDSLDQLSSRDGVRQLGWIPHPLPAHVRFVVSTRPGDTLEVLRHRLDGPANRSTRLLEVGPLSEAEGDELLSRWLDVAQRALQPAQRSTVLNAFGSARGNPLYLRLAVEEARRWTSEQEPEPLGLDGAGRSALEAIIEHNTFARLADEDDHGEVFVSHALGYLAASRHGLAEDELLDLLSRDPDVYSWFVRTSYHVPTDLRASLDRHLTDEIKEQLRISDGDPAAEWLRQVRAGERTLELTQLLAEVRETRGDPGLRLPVVLWSRLYADLEPYLTERAVEGGSLIGFYHRELHDAAARCYLPEESGDARGDAATLHGRLADYFQSRADPTGERSWSIDGQRSDLRGLSELAHHLGAARRWGDLDRLLGDPVFLERTAARLGGSVGATGSQVRPFLEECVATAPEDVLSAFRRLRNIALGARDLGASLELHFVRGAGSPDEGAGCPHCQAPGLVHGHIDLGGVDYYDNYFSWCRSCLWAWHVEDYSTGDSGLREFDPTTGTY